MIGYGKSGLFEFQRPLDQVVYSVGAVEKGVFRMAVKMYKGHELKLAIQRADAKIIWWRESRKKSKADRSYQKHSRPFPDEGLPGNWELCFWKLRSAFDFRFYLLVVLITIAPDIGSDPTSRRIVAARTAS